MATVELNEVSKVFGGMPVVDKISLTIPDGEFVVLVGPSGCGKSTLLRLIAGLEDLSSGEILIDGESVGYVPSKDRNIAMVFQNYALYPHMNVFDNMSFALRMKKVPDSEKKAKVGAVAEMLGLSEYLTRYPRELSGGQRQRVAMGRAIVREPKVFLFDEPLSNLDAKLRTQMRMEIKALQNRLKATAIYVTHDQIEAMTMADRVVILNRGKIEQVGRPLDVYDHPANVNVAGFIGSPPMNFVTGDVVRENGRPIFRADDGFFVDLPPELNLPREGRIICGIRPQAVYIADQGIPVQVSIVEPTGSETVILLKIGNGSLTMLSPTRQQVSPGQRINVRLNASMVRFFDAASGVAIKPMSAPQRRAHA